MTEKSVFWTTSGTGDGSDDYTMDELVYFVFRKLFGYGANQGVMLGVDNELDITVGSGQITIQTGGALVYGFPYENTDNVIVSVPAPLGATRVDIIALEADWSAQTVRIVRVEGTPGVGAPSLIQTPSTTYQIPLWQLSVTIAGAITETDVREYLEYATLINLLNMADNSVDTNQLVDGAVTNAKLENDSVSAAKIQANAVGSSEIASGAVQSDELGTGAVIEAKIGTAAVTNTKIGPDAVDGTKIADDSINSEHYVNGSIDGVHIANDQIDSQHYVDGSIDLAHLAADSVNGSKIANDSINSEHYVDGSIDTAHIANEQVTAAKIANRTRRVPVGLTHSLYQSSYPGTTWQDHNGVVCPDGYQSFVTGMLPCPNDLVTGSTTKIVVIIYNAAGTGNMYWHLFVNWSALGEGSFSDSAQNTIGPTPSLQNRVAVELTLPSVAIGDFICLDVLRDALNVADTFNNTAYIRSVYLEYLADS